MKLNKPQLKTVLEFLDKKRPEFYQRVVYVDFDKGEIVATDGSILLVLEHVEGLDGTGTALIPRESIEGILKLAPGKGDHQGFTVTRNELRLGPASLPYTPVETEYIKFRKAIPEDVDIKTPGVFGFYASKYIKALEDIQDAFCTGLYYHLPPTILHPLKCSVCTLRGIDITIVILPKNLRTVVNSGDKE